MRVLNRFLQILMLFVLLCTAGTVALAQHSYTEFLEEKDIDKKTEIGLYLWNEYLRSDLDSLKMMSVELLVSAADAGSEFGRAAGYRSLASYQVRTGNIDEGLKHLRDARKYFELQENFQLISETYAEIGNAHYLAGEYNDAIKAYLKSLEAGKLSPDKTDAFNAKNGLSRAYCAMGDTAVGVYTMAEYKDASIKMGKMEAAADAYAYLGQIEMDRGNLDLSKEYYEKSVRYSEQSMSKVHLTHALNNKAILHFNLGELDSSLYYFEESLRLREQLGHKKGVVESYYNLGFFYLETHDYHNSYIHFTKSAEVAKENSFKTDEADALAELVNICGELGYDKELKEIERRLTELNTYIEEKSIADKEIIDYAEKVISDAEMKEDAVEEEKSYTYVWMIAGGLFLVLLIYLRLRRKS